MVFPQDTNIVVLPTTNTLSTNEITKISPAIPEIVPYLITNIRVYTNYYTNAAEKGQMQTNSYIYTNYTIKPVQSIINTPISN